MVNSCKLIFTGSSPRQQPSMNACMLLVLHTENLCSHQALLMPWVLGKSVTQKDSLPHHSLQTTQPVPVRGRGTLQLFVLQMWHPFLTAL